MRAKEEVMHKALIKGVHSFYFFADSPVLEMHEYGECPDFIDAFRKGVDISLSSWEDCTNANRCIFVLMHSIHKPWSRELIEKCVSLLKVKSWFYHSVISLKVKRMADFPILEKETWHTWKLILDSMHPESTEYFHHIWGVCETHPEYAEYIFKPFVSEDKRMVCMLVDGKKCLLRAYKESPQIIMIDDGKAVKTNVSIEFVRNMI